LSQTDRSANDQADLDNLPRHVVYLRGLDATRGDTASTTTLDRQMHGLLNDALALLQAATTSAGSAAKVWMVTRDAVGLPDMSSGVSLAAAPLWGLGRTFALEYPDHWGGLIDAALPTSSAAARAIANELLSDTDEDQVALNSSGRHVARLVRRSRHEAGAPLTVSGEGTYLVTGGTGKLGLQVARWLASQGASVRGFGSRPERHRTAGRTGVDCGGGCLQGR
jgi:epothilone polyketide synthase D